MKHGISQQSLYFWTKNYAGLGLNELRELRQLREENNMLKRLVEALSPDHHMARRVTREEVILLPHHGK